MKCPDNIDIDIRTGYLLPDNERVRNARVELIMRFPWEWYFSLTFKNAIHPEEANKRLRYFMNQISKNLYGNHWARNDLSVEYVWGTELQDRGTIHFHIILHTPDRKLSKYQLLKYHEQWKKIAGISDLDKIEPIRDLEKVSRYCSKYVTEDDRYGIDFKFRNGTRKALNQDYGTRLSI